MWACIENAPKVFISESGKPAGIFIDIIEHIAKSEGWTLRYVPGTWGEGLDRLSKGEIDLMPDVAYSLEREKVFSFHREPVLSDWFQVYANKDKQIRSIVDLDGKKIVVLERSVQQEAFRQLAENFRFKITLISLPDYKQAFEVVAEGRPTPPLPIVSTGWCMRIRWGLKRQRLYSIQLNFFLQRPEGLRMNC